jgi:hypothetical protein
MSAIPWRCQDHAMAFPDSLPDTLPADGGQDRGGGGDLLWIPGCWSPGHTCRGVRTVMSHS